MPSQFFFGGFCIFFILTLFSALIFLLGLSSKPLILFGGISLFCLFCLIPYIWLDHLKSSNNRKIQKIKNKEDVILYAYCVCCSQFKSQFKAEVGSGTRSIGGGELAQLAEEIIRRWHRQSSAPEGAENPLDS